MAILIALAFGLLFLLVAMVVNIGFLVAAKINLQNATDLAAYAGAAQQARYLTEIGKWNYEMRRNYKAMAFDYMIVLNGERRYHRTNTSDRAFKDYIINRTDAPKGFPLVCATLQRQGSSTIPAISITCQNSTSLNFQTALINSANALAQSGDAVTAACGDGGDTATCLNVTNAAFQQHIASFSLTQTATDTDDKLANYEEYPYNYNRRLIAWMLHDYRHLQTRIRGLHAGDISLGQYSNANPFVSSSGRWALKKESNPAPVIFENSPISVAAQVINGYTQIAAGAPPPTSGITAIAPGEILKNPIHNAAYSTFKKNLMEVLYNGAKLYTIIPRSNAGGNSAPNGMAGGCNGLCPEFSGPYLKLDNHDVSFWVAYTIIKKPNPSLAQYSYGQHMEPVTHFPVGVAKDLRVATYYTVVGTASTKDIPFNVFFGSNERSQEAIMIAVAAARPFGSRIGPFINEECSSENINGKGGDDAKSTCEKNGLDPLYPFETSNVIDKVPNFSLSDTSKNDRLGVKLCVDKTEYGPIISGGLWGVQKPATSASDFHTFLYQKGSDQNSRWRVYTKPGDMNSDDGFPTRPTPISKNPNNNNYLDNDANPTHPFGTRDSVMAWSGKTAIETIPAAQRNNYEGFLDKYRGNAIYQFGEIPDRKSDNQPYKVYVFRYPDRENAGWDIKGLTKVPNNTSEMEKAFANAMAVSMFEATRYILPYRSNPANQSLDQDVMNYIVTTANNGRPFLFGGVQNTDAQPAGCGNILFADTSAPGTATCTNNIIKQDDEGTAGLGINSGGDVFAETYTAWRFGSRGYRVKLINVQDLIGSTRGFQNPLETRYVLPDSGITIDLANIKY